MATSLPPDAPPFRGEFRIAAEADAAGRTLLREQSVCAPFHLSKTYWTGEALLVQAVNATAGVFAGDRLELSVRVGAGAKVLLTSPSAHRIHTMPSGSACQVQDFRVARGGWLEVLPELFIPQAGCRYRQQTRIEVEQGGGLFFCETLAPGRVACGEQFAFARVEWALDLRVGGVLAARERFVLQSGDASLWGLRHDGRGYFAACYLVSPDPLAAPDLPPPGEALAADAAWGGWSLVAPSVAVLRVLARDSEALRDCLRAARAHWADRFPALRADARKL